MNAYTDIDGHDLFCGGGGSSEGLTQIPGVGITMAVNHWPLAVKTHQVNHPAAEHDCADISQVDPRRYPRATILWASPDCTNHTKATGRKRDLSTHISDGKTLPTDPQERSRATMWDVVRFAEYHQYEAIMVENVVEVRDWAPFGAWLQAMRALGYEHQMVYLNSAHAVIGGIAAPTLRDRFYVVFTKRGARKPDIAKWTNPFGTCEACGTYGQLDKRWKKGHDRDGGVYKRQYLFACASCGVDVRPDMPAGSTVVDFSDLGPLVFDRKPAPVARTLWKIETGLIKHAVDGMAMPFIVELRGGGSTTRSLRDPLSTITAGGNHHGLVVPPGYIPATDAGTRHIDGVAVSECHYRILTVHERKLATAFGAEYVLLGGDESQVRMIGNAVTPPAARALGAAVVEALTGEARLPIAPPLALVTTTKEAA